VLDQGSGLLPVHLQSMANHRLCVVSASTVQQPADKGFIVKLHEQDLLQGLLEIAEKLIKCLCLGKVSGESIEKPTHAGNLETLAHNGQYKCITDQFASGHDGFHLLAKVSASTDLSPEEITRGKVQKLLLLSQFLGLSAFASPWWAEKEKSMHHWRTIPS
jgi:hypothetical protein